MTDLRSPSLHQAGETQNVVRRLDPHAVSSNRRISEMTRFSQASAYVEPRGQIFGPFILKRFNAVHDTWGELGLGFRV